mmetsp:Transcript_9516/g.14066  ORF Transcript_9516/g.14066 Transcript_9516/m.14066 type:complete len:460 (-) Transcript_9516:543-1922(-)
MEFEKSELQTQMNKLTVKVGELQTQNTSQGLVIKNLSNMIKLLHEDVTRVKVENKKMKKIIIDLVMSKNEEHESKYKSYKTNSNTKKTPPSPSDLLNNIKETLNASAGNFFFKKNNSPTTPTSNKKKGFPSSPLTSGKFSSSKKKRKNPFMEDPNASKINTEKVKKNKYGTASPLNVPYTLYEETDDIISTNDFNKVVQSGLRLYELGRHSDAHSAFGCMTSLQDGGSFTKLQKSSLHFKRAYILMHHLKQYETAVKEANFSLENDRMHYKSYLVRGDAYMKLALFEKAVASFRSARNLNFSDLAKIKLKAAKKILAEQQREKTRSSSAYSFTRDRLKETVGSPTTPSFNNNSSFKQSSPKQPKQSPPKSRPKSSPIFKAASAKNFYDLLGISKTGDVNVIKKAYKRRAAKCHPDRFVNGSDDDRLAAEEEFKEVLKAYQTLKNPSKRMKYDLSQFYVL